MRYSLRTLLILMLLVGPLCILGWPAYESWRDERARVAKETREVKRAHQSIAILDRQCTLAGGQGGPALSGKETIDELLRIEYELQEQIQAIQLMTKLTQQNTAYGGGIKPLREKPLEPLERANSYDAKGTQDSEP